METGRHFAGNPSIASNLTAVSGKKSVDTIVKFDDGMGMRYPGGKAKTFAQIVNRLPRHDVYIEPFLGKGSVLRAKHSASLEIGIDLDERVLRDRELAERGVDLHKTDGIAFLEEYPFTGSEVVYCDPPYLPETRKSSKVYRFELSQNDHLRLLSVIKRINANVIISGYPSQFYDDELNTWTRHSFQAKAHDGIREEVIWFNFPEPKELHDYRYLGSNFRERQTIKRRVERIQNRIQSLTPQEQCLLRNWLSDEVISSCN